MIRKCRDCRERLCGNRKLNGRNYETIGPEITQDHKQFMHFLVHFFSTVMCDALE